MKVLLSGASGLVGSALVPFLRQEGHRVTTLVRSEPRNEEEVRWDPAAGQLDGAAIEGQDAVVHLSGESIAEGRWTPEKKARIRESRVGSTGLLSRTLAALASPPGVMVSASAVGYYGDRGDERLREESPPGKGFLAEVCLAWEAATEPAAQKGIRVVPLRIAPVLSSHGGVLAKMLGPFRMGVGGHVGSGRQWMSWIALEDLVGAIHHALTTGTLRGATNAVAPNPVTNAEFTRTLAGALGKPAMMVLPAFAARLAFGEMAEETVLASQRVEPARLLASGYRFRFPTLQEALRHALEGGN